MGIINRANQVAEVAEFTSTPIEGVPVESGWDTRAYDLMELLILDQYTNSVNLKLYMKAYLTELDALMFETRQVYLGRMLEFAIGKQLDIIGEILQQSRSILVVAELPGKWFGFNGHTEARGMGNLEQRYPDSLPGNPGDAPEYIPGKFISTNSYPWEFVPLTDTEYRGVLLARGFVCNNKTRDVNTTYKVIHLMLGRVPKYIKLIVNSERNITLELEAEWTTSIEASLLESLKDWYIPMGVTYNVSLI